MAISPALSIILWISYVAFGFNKRQLWTGIKPVSPYNENPTIKKFNRDEGQFKFYIKNLC